MMVNSIYTHKEIFLRELISNASDALDKLYFRSLTDESVKLSRSDYQINIVRDAEKRTLTIIDNGCGMSEGELESNLGTIAKSGSFEFKRDNGKNEDVDVIGQFGVGFYSAFMVADKIQVKSRVFGDAVAHLWESEGADGYTVSECEKESFGTEIILYIKKDTEDEKYSDYLDEHRIAALVKKYSDYIRYPIRMAVSKSVPKADNEKEYETVTEVETLNSMVPLWKKDAKDVSSEEYNDFYRDKFYDYLPPARVITQKSEGTATFTSLMFIPEKAPFGYYSGEYKRGLELYSSGVMIMECCEELLPEYFGFVRGLVDSQDLSLNISREMLQHDRQLKLIAKAIEKKIKSELEKMLSTEREKYEKLFDAFGLQLKFGIYADYGMHKDVLKDLILFRSSADEKKYITLKEYIASMKDTQSEIYYAAGESVEKIEMLPRVEALKARGYEILYLTDDIDEFAIKMLDEYDGKKFKNATSVKDTADDDNAEREKKENEENRDLLDFIKESVGKNCNARFTFSLVKHPVCLSSEGEMSIEMEKILRRNPEAANMPRASLTLEINASHEIASTLKRLYKEDKERLKKYSVLLYHMASLTSGVSTDNPAQICDLIGEMLV
jgi:molecular chaperone HtpG